MDNQINILFSGVRHKNSRKNFTKPPLAKNKTNETKIKTAVMENTVTSHVVALCCDKDFALLNIIEYRVTEECLPTFNINVSW